LHTVLSENFFKGDLSQFKIQLQARLDVKSTFIKFLEFFHSDLQKEKSYLEQQTKLLKIVSQSNGLRTAEYLPMLKYKGLYEKTNYELSFNKDLTEEESETLKIENKRYHEKMTLSRATSLIDLFRQIIEDGNQMK